MQEVATDNGMAPVTGESTNPPANDVGGLIAAVESKMAELMAWHGQQTKQLETDKTVLQAQAEKQQEELKADAEKQHLTIEAEKKTLEERVAQVDQQRIKLVELTSKLRAEETAMSREWAEVQRERESVQRRAVELAKQREQIDERAKSWLEKTAEDLSQPLKLTEGTDHEDESSDRHAA